nr:Toll/interleukin-1 receptor (TIR) domain-containing protein [Tanacetum cinerariifolium]
MVIGRSSITNFFQLIKSKVDRLANLDSLIKDSSLVTYAINEIYSKYSDAARVIHLREKAPTFDDLWSMMLVKETNMSHTSHGNLLFHNTSSSPTVLVASTTTSDKTKTMGNSGLEVCRNFKRGSCSYGIRFKFLHGDHDMRPHPNTNKVSLGMYPLHVDRLANLDSLIKDSSLVTYAINEIYSKYSDAARVIHLREKAPTFDDLWSMMLVKETNMSHTSH